MLDDPCKRGMMEEQGTAIEQQPLEEIFKDVKPENVKEMMHDARERMDNVAGVRDRLDQKITYFLGLILVVFSSLSGFGITPMLGLLSQQRYLAVSLFMICIVGLLGIACFLVLALLPKITYATRLCPESYWANNRLEQDPKIMSILVSGDYQYINNHMRKLIAKKAQSLKISVFLFTLTMLAFMVLVFLFHSPLWSLLSSKA